MAITGKNRFGNIPLWGGGTYSVHNFDVEPRYLWIYGSYDTSEQYWNSNVES